MDTVLIVVQDQANRLSGAISDLLAVCSPAPVWTDKFGWRHRDEYNEVSNYWLTKLAGISSTFNAAVKLAIEGYWFQVAILARVITEAQLSIAFTIPSPNMADGEWPNSKQKEAIENHFKETWDNPDSPYDNNRLRPHIRKLSAFIGLFQSTTSALNPHDASQTAIQWMRFLSDYTHMAYPQLMELFEGSRGYVLLGKQTRSSFYENEFGRLLSSSYAYTAAVATLLGKIISGCEERATVEKNARGMEIFRGKHEKLADILRVLEENGNIVDTRFPSPDDEIRKTLRNFKNGNPRQAGE